MSINVIQQLNAALEKMPEHLQQEVLAFATRLSVQPSTNGSGNMHAAEKSARKALWAKLAAQMKELEANPPADPYPVDYSARFDEIHYQPAK
ncbi:MAG: hypothetical protein QM703_17445 [Gemmatales bacterium]